MRRPLPAADVIPQVASHNSESSVYAAAPPTRDEFSGDDDPITWDADGWDDQDAFDLLRSRKLEQEVLDIVDGPSPR